MLIFHITIALLSLVTTGLALVLPSRLKLRLSQGLIALTLGSGSYLVLTMHVNLLKVCSVGLIYTAIASYGMVSVQRKLALQNT